MTGTTISTTGTAALKLTLPKQNPVTVTATGTIVTDGNYAIYDAVSTPGTITNRGLLDSKAGSGTGVIMAGARSVLSNYGAIVSGSGVYMLGGQVSVSNTGTINGMASNGDGIALAKGGTITNGSSSVTNALDAGGNDGILSESLGATVENYGTITGRAGSGIKLESGNGTIANEASGLINGAAYGVVINAACSVSNLGAVEGQSGAGIYIGGTGTVSNGDTLHGGALVSGGAYGIFTGGKNSQVSNDGTVNATTNSGIGVCLSHGGTLQNGAAGALIHGGLDGVVVHNYAAKINNNGTISAGDGVGVRIESTTGLTTIVNGSSAAATALIAGNSYGISVAGSGTVLNDGTITAIGGGGIYIAGNATVNNGGAADTGARISAGRYGIFTGGTATVKNFGSITGTNSGGIGVRLNGGGTLTNGSALAAHASITGGGTGLRVNNGNATISNFGTLAGPAEEGVFIANNGGTDSITNSAGALITGFIGLILGNSGTLTNAGTITGTGGTAVSFTGTSDTLVVDPGAVFRGTVTGGTASVLEFAAGTGTVAQIGTEFTKFGTATFDAGATWSLTGTNSVANVLDDGTVTAAAQATLTVGTAVDAGSTGLFQLATGATLELAADTGAQDRMSFLGKADLIIDNAAQFGMSVGTSSYTGPEIENFAAGDMIDLKSVAATSTSFIFNASSGLLQIKQAGNPVATLFFQSSTLGTGSFHLGDDGSTHLLITHS